MAVSVEVRDRQFFVVVNDKETKVLSIDGNSANWVGAVMKLGRGEKVDVSRTSSHYFSPRRINSFLNSINRQLNTDIQIERFEEDGKSFIRLVCE